MKRFQIVVDTLRFGLLLAAPVCVIGGMARADEQSPSSYPQQGYSQNAASKIQVIGSVQKMSLDAEHADVLSVLKAVLKQGQKMFAPDATVTGQVTLSLSDLPLETLLKEICEQNFLRYQIQNGIYRFSRDEEAVKASFTKLKSLNAELRLQLRTMGLEFPEDTILDVPPSPGRIARTADALEPDSVARNLDKKSYASLKAKDGSKATLNSDPGFRARGGAEPTQQDKVRSARRDLLGNYAEAFTLDNGVSNEKELFGAEMNQPVNGLPYADFIQRNRFVSFDIPREKPLAVSSVLQQLGQQANVSVYVDQSIPNSLKFRLWGHLSPRQLPDALNAIAPAARLQWRWSGNASIYVVPAPDFQIAFGDNLAPKNTIQGSYLILPPNSNRTLSIPNSNSNGNRNTNGTRKP